MQDQLSSKNSNIDGFKKEFIFSLFKEKKVQLGLYVDDVLIIGWTNNLYLF